MGTTEYILNLSGGKDSLAAGLGIMERGLPLTKAVFFDGGMEFQAVYENIKRFQPLLADYGAELVILKPDMDFLTKMLVAPVEAKDGTIHYGYDWCGGQCRWFTACKVSKINAYLNTLGPYKQYMGIAVDEPDRIKNEKHKEYPLVEWGMTEMDCLKYCYSKGWKWREEGIELYQILDRVSCWCCGNKNLKELRNIYHYLPKYWQKLKGLQSRISRPFYAGTYSIFDLEKRFQIEDGEVSLFDYLTAEQKEALWREEERRWYTA